MLNLKKEVLENVVLTAITGVIAYVIRHIYLLNIGPQTGVTYSLIEWIELIDYKAHMTNVSYAIMWVLILAVLGTLSAVSIAMYEKRES